MALQIYPPIVIIRTLIAKFFPYRGLAPAPRGLARDAPARAYSDDEVISDMKQFGYVRLDALRAQARGARDWVAVLVLAADGKYAHHSPDLRRLLDGVEAERPAKEGRLDEIIVVAEEEFFAKKILVDVIADLRAKQAGGADPAGHAPFYSAHPYHIFSDDIPENQSVPRHRLMSSAELEEFLRRTRLTYRDLPTVFTTDPPVVWLGGREGQAVEIDRPSQTAATALYVRRVEQSGL